MATRTINSPGVEIRERDLTLTAPSNVGTNIFVTGYADQGPLDEVIKLSSRDDLNLIYGIPTTSAERYFHHTVSELLNSPGNIYSSRLPYGAGTGVGFGSKYSALIYPTLSYVGLSGYSIEISETTLDENVLSASEASFTLSDGETYSVGFSSTTTAPSNIALDAYAAYIGSTPTRASLLTSLSGAIISLDSTASLVKTTTNLTVTLSETVIPTSDFSSLASGISAAEQSGDSSNLDINTGSYLLGAPTHMEFTREQYESIVDGSGFEWSATATGSADFDSVSSIGGAGVVVLNKAQSTINDQYEGYFIGITDNMFVNPGTDYEAIRRVQTVTQSTSITEPGDFVTIPETTLEFDLSAGYVVGSDSASEVMENVATYDISERTNDDLIGIATFKLRKSLYATESFKLGFAVEDKIVGSIDYARSNVAPRGGPAINYFIGNADSNSRNVEIFVNDHISNRLGGNFTGVDGIPDKRVRVLSNQLQRENDPVRSGLPSSFINSVIADSTLKLADSLFTLSTYSGERIDDKVIGNTPDKVQRALLGVRNLDVYDIDLVVEAGLGTVYAASNGSGTTYYDEQNYNGSLSNQVDGLRTSDLNIGTAGETIRNNYMAIFQEFESFCAPLRGGRGDTLFIADPLRQIFVTGKNLKIDDVKTSIFQRDLYWATRHQFETANTSYACVYANWAKVYDTYIGQNIWVPFSGFAAAVMARTSAARFPWIAPAGFNNGLIQTALDIASVPNQKERDELYKANLNPITFFPAQGQVVFGQKTLLKKPSAFDRINVRRLFQALERPTRKAAQYFVFEPNTVFTRTRLINVLTPIFERAAANEGLYDYLIVCDERNNTPEVIDNNELIVDIYIKPVRAAEFILINFVATRTDANFQEIIGA